MTVKIATVVGARPQFVKAAMVSRALQRVGAQGGAEAPREIIIHTGQHYDTNMSQVFFDDLGLPASRHNLGVGSASHGEQTGRMLIRLEAVLQQERPDIVLTYGDTNSTLAAALVASKLHIPLVHVEAGLRSFNKRMPEELNRILTDHAADLLFCPTATAVQNLRAEGITQHVYNVGDVMYDATLFFATLAERRAAHVRRLSEGKPYYLATVHRQENTDNPERLAGILEALGRLNEVVIFPVHPRTASALRQHNLWGLEGSPNGIRLIPPVSFLEMLNLEKHARLILTDSGGVQKEAYFLNVPCVTLREETEWVETVAAGVNVLAGACTERIVSAVDRLRHGALSQTSGPLARQPFGDGQAATKIVEILLRFPVVSTEAEKRHRV